MVAYQHYVELSRSADSEARGQAAHLAARAFLSHDGPADEQAALYAALVGFLDDSSVKVRAALAYGLLHSEAAPRPILISLLYDIPVIARAVAQYSPSLLDADLIALVRAADATMLNAVAMRETLTTRVAESLLSRSERPITLIVLRRDVALGEAALNKLVLDHADDATIRGALFDRQDLPARARLDLIHKVKTELASLRIVKGAVAPRRLERLFRDAVDTATTAIGEAEALRENPAYAQGLIASDRVSTRTMLHAIVHGHVLFFADCLAELASTPRDKVFAILHAGGRPALNALLARAGFGDAVRNAIVRLIGHARSADLADDVAARHFVVTAMTSELVSDHDGVVPPELEDVFGYLTEQNIVLARKAARGVMGAFAAESEPQRPMLPNAREAYLALPAA